MVSVTQQTIMRTYLSPINYNFPSSEIGILLQIDFIVRLFLLLLLLNPEAKHTGSSIHVKKKMKIFVHYTESLCCMKL